MPRQSSLFRRLMFGFAAVLVAVALMGLVSVVSNAKSSQRDHTASENKARTREMLLSLANAGDDPVLLLKTAEAIEAVRRELFTELAYASRVRVRVWKHQRLLYNSAPELPDALPVAGRNPVSGEYGWVRWTETDQGSGVVVERSHEVDDEWIFTMAGARILLMPSTFNLLLLLLPAWIIVSLGLRPLRAVADSIAQRSDADLTALPDSNYRELSPLIRAINQLMVRLGQRIEREHEFLSEAAHEMKTPLAAIQINAHLLLSRSAAGNIEGSNEAGIGLRDGVARATHTVHQLLTLERIGAERGADALPLTPLDAFLRDRLAAAAPLAIARGIELELRADAPCPMPLHRESMAALIDNLIGNAIKYSPQGGRIAVHLAPTAGGARLWVADQGPGIAPGLHQKVFERFYRVPGQEQLGSGLGLAIAARAAAVNHGVIRLENAAPGPGLVAIVEFATGDK